METVRPYGPYGCRCHPFENWDECDAAHKKKFQLGQLVTRRCNRWEGETVKEPPKGIVIECRGKGWYIVKYGPYPRDEHLEHAAEIFAVPQKNGIQLSLFNI